MSARKTTSKKRPTSQSSKKSASASSPKAKAGTAVRGKSRPGRSAGEEEVTIDRRRSAGRRAAEDVPDEPAKSPIAPPLERRAKVNRRRQIDPTTCERDYSDLEVEFMNALDDYKRKSGRMFPTCSEVLEVVRSLGYAKLSPNDVSARGSYCELAERPIALTLEPDSDLAVAELSSASYAEFTS